MIMLAGYQMDFYARNAYHRPNVPRIPDYLPHFPVRICEFHVAFVFKLQPTGGGSFSSFFLSKVIIPIGCEFYGRANQSTNQERAI